jgi:hypothetical protein
LSSAEKRECYSDLVRWLVSRNIPGRTRRVMEQPYADQVAISVDAVVAGRENRYELS